VRGCLSVIADRIESAFVGIKGRIAITGRPGVGKTTLVEALIDRLPVPTGGMLTREIRVCGHRVGFALVDVETGEQGVLAHVHQRVGPRIGQYTVNLETLESLGIPAILRAVKNGILVVIDEIAPMELCSSRFVPAVEAALASDSRLIVTTHANANHPIAHRARQELTLVRVRLSNRDGLLDVCLDHLGFPAGRTPFGPPQAQA
jgi:nucleoside-triphosphatase